MPLSSESFRAVLGRFASGVTVVTTRDDTGTDYGMTVSSFASLSLEPPLVLACVSETAEMHGVLATGRRVGISILSAQQEALSRRFSEFEGSRRFEGIGFTRDTHGVAVLEDALAWLGGEVVARHDGGDHGIFVVRVDAATAHELRPLLYYRSGYAELER